MSKHLLIVESPAKAKTLHKYLGKDYQILASYGHVRDLVPKNGAVDPDDNFAMNYETIARNAKHVNTIARAMESADDLLLATDPDREGEAISWHLYQLLEEKGALKGKPVHRVVFYEITKRAINQAVKTPRTIAMDLVNAQQARRALDYLVGFHLSPLLWRKVQPGLSAGRVQSPALRMIVAREREIEAFKSEEYWKISARASQQGQVFQAALTRFAGEKVEQFSFTDEASAQATIAKLKTEADGKLRVDAVQAKERKRNPSAPFITSTMQQEAAHKLRFTAQRTMRSAQKLYEDGFITYMRTDSVNLAQEAEQAIRALIKTQYGDDYLPKAPRRYKTKSKNAQEAHEAIRPTNVALTAEALAQDMGADERRLYDLIHKRALASQMASAVIEQVSVDLLAGARDYTFRATGSVLRFPGFMKVYREDQDGAQEEENTLLPEMTTGEEIPLQDILGSQHFTMPPPRYSEASLIRTLEEYGIGRPSTYANIISTLLNRDYVALDNRRFIATSIGKVVNDFLTKHFERYVDYDFTARLEDDLDAVSRGEQAWKPLLGSFWGDFHDTVEDKKSISREEVMQAQTLGTDPKSGKPVSVRFGRYGPFVQIGSRTDDEKPRFASIPDDRDFDTITLEQALELFKLPRKLGETEDNEEISTNIGRYGPYIRFGRKYVSLPKEEDPLTVTRERALALIAEKKEQERKKYIKEIAHGTEILQVLNGRFGPYVTNGTVNASIPKKIDPQTVTLETALELLEKAKDRKGKRKTTGKRTVAGKKTAN